MADPTHRAAALALQLQVEVAEEPQEGGRQLRQVALACSTGQHIFRGLIKPLV